MTLTASNTLLPIDFRKYGAMGVWVYGDGKGELLNIQLENPRGLTYDNTDDHYIDIAFTGWRYFELHIPERDAERYADYQWPYRNEYAVYRFGDWRPASTTVCINSLSSPGARIELDMIVALPKQAS